jgi:hypothetical protein
MRTLLRDFWKGMLLAFAIAIVMSAVYLPEARSLVVIWLLGVALMWRSSPRSNA